MKPLPLQLRYAGSPVHEVSAWFLPGDDPASWLTEIAAWDIDLPSVRLRIVSSGGAVVGALWDGTPVSGQSFRSQGRQTRSQGRQTLGGPAAGFPESLARLATSELSSRDGSPNPQSFGRQGRQTLGGPAAGFPQSLARLATSELSSRDGSPNPQSFGSQGRQTLGGPAAGFPQSLAKLATPELSSRDGSPNLLSAAVPFGKLAGRMFVPVDAQIFPPVSNQELRGLLDEGLEYVWHPQYGVTVFAESGTLTLADLIAAPPLQAVDWNCAEPGSAYARRLQAVRAAEELTVEDVFGESRDDIGTRTDDLKDLPRAPAEPSSGKLAQLGRDSLKGLAKAIDWTVQHVPGMGMLGGVLGAAGWAVSQLSRLSKVDDALRNKELLRLMDLLKRDPDEGLKYALPLGDTGNYRGTAEGGNLLSEQNVNFNLGALFRVGVGAFWEISAEHMQQLRKHYQDLANRELQLGRYRRAAYIFAHLLGDVWSAAGSLRTGRHYQEAAALYRDRLRQPLEAARCLAEGGLHAEAIALFEELQEYELAGDSYLKLQDRDRALHSYRSAAAKARSSGNFFGAATILEQKVDAPDEALQTLELGWPLSPQAANCLSGQFALLRRLHRAEQIKSRLSELRDSPIPYQHRIALPAILAEQARDALDPELRAQAEDATRVVVSRALRDAAANEIPVLLGSVRALVPGDSLLQHDCERFSRRRAKTPPLRKTPATPRGQATLLRKWRLLDDVKWLEMMVVHDVVYAMGVRNRDIIFVRSDWEGVVHQPDGAPWRGPNIEVALTLRWAADEIHDTIHVCSSIQSADTKRIFPATDAFPHAEIHLASFAAIDFSGSGSTLAFLTLNELGLTLRTTDSSTNLLGEVSVMPFDRLQDWDPRDSFLFGLLMRRGKAFVFAGQKLLIVERDRVVVEEDFGRTIRRIAGSAPFARARIAISFEQGGLVYWPSKFDQGRTREFASDMPNPIAAFNRGGYLIAAHKQGAEVYAPSGEDLSLAKTLPAFEDEVIAVLANAMSRQFAIGLANGEIRLYEV